MATTRPDLQTILTIHNCPPNDTVEKYIRTYFDYLCGNEKADPVLAQQNPERFIAAVRSKHIALAIIRYALKHEFSFKILGRNDFTSAMPSMEHGDKRLFSHFHFAVLRYKDGKTFLIDLASKNGTILENAMPQSSEFDASVAVFREIMNPAAVAFTEDHIHHALNSALFESPDELESVCLDFGKIMKDELPERVENRVTLQTVNGIYKWFPVYPDQHIVLSGQVNDYRFELTNDLSLKFVQILPQTQVRSISASPLTMFATPPTQMRTAQMKPIEDENICAARLFFRSAVEKLRAAGKNTTALEATFALTLNNNSRPALT